jgi:hypothetical protein
MLAAVTGGSLMAAGIPEPPLVIYGQMRDNHTGARISFGTLTWQPAVGGSNPVVLTRTPTNLHDQYSFLQLVPFEPEINGNPIP